MQNYGESAQNPRAAELELEERLPLTKGMDPEDQTGSGAPVAYSTPALERVGVACAATLVPSLLLVHALAAMVHTQPGISPAAAAVSVAVVAIGFLHGLISWRFPVLPVWGWGVMPAVAAVLLAGVMGSGAGAISVWACCSLQGWTQSRVARALPESIDGLTRRRPWRALGWSLLAILAVVQTGRIATHEADPSVPWWVTSKNPAWAAHLCTSAYVYAADLHEQGEKNIYTADYPPDDSSAGRQPTVENLRPHLECGFEYPPPFLLLPWAALQVTNDFYVIRPVWLAFIGLGFFAVAVSLGLWVGGPRGRLALWLLPAMWAAVPTLQTFQFGQFQLMVFGLALGGMVAIETRRTGLGGALLGAAIVTKLYPAVFLILLAMQRRWRALGMTMVWMVGFGALGLALLGPDPYRAFLSDQLPGILDGSFFDLSGLDEKTRDMLNAVMTGVSTVPARLALLGFSVLPVQIGPWLGRALALGILALAWRARRTTASRSHAVMLWIALLNLVVLQGPTAFVDYTTATSLWLLTFVGVDMARNRALAIGGWICWLLVGTLLGTFPIPDDPTGEWPDLAISAAQISASTLLVTMLIVPLNLWCAMRTDEQETNG